MNPSSSSRRRGLTLAAAGLVVAGACIALLRWQLGSGSRLLLVPTASLFGWLMFAAGLFQAVFGERRGRFASLWRILFVVSVTLPAMVLSLAYALRDSRPKPPTETNAPSAGSERIARDVERFRALANAEIVRSAPVQASEAASGPSPPR